MLPSMGLQRVRRHLMTEEEQFAHSPYLPFLYTFPHGIFSTCTVFLISSFKIEGFLDNFNQLLP